ncbi:MAG: hypothetical protein EOP34_00965 [Rickettsiales bacterium]|nr:MAG: hypothetical protein EOP34_00965 [Rickettsiales bacterium]
MNECIHSELYIYYIIYYMLYNNFITNRGGCIVHRASCIVHRASFEFDRVYIVPCAGHCYAYAAPK